jgi:hypothetical protein
MSGNPNFELCGAVEMMENLLCEWAYYSTFFWTSLGENIMQYLNLGADNLVFRVEWDNSMLYSMFCTHMTNGQGVRSSPYLKKSNEPASPVQPVANLQKIAAHLDSVLRRLCSPPPYILDPANTQ